MKKIIILLVLITVFLNKNYSEEFLNRIDSLIANRKSINIIIVFKEINMISNRKMTLSGTNQKGDISYELTANDSSISLLAYFKQSENFILKTNIPYKILIIPTSYLKEKKLITGIFEMVHTDASVPSNDLKNELEKIKIKSLVFRDLHELKVKLRFDDVRIYLNTYPHENLSKANLFLTHLEKVYKNLTLDVSVFQPEEIILEFKIELYILLSRLHFVKKSHKKSLLYLKKALSTFNKISESELNEYYTMNPILIYNKEEIFLNCCLNFIELNDFKNFNKYIDLFEKFNRSHNKFKLLAPMFNYLKAIYYLNKKQFEKAFRKFQNSPKFLNNNQYYGFMSKLSLHNIGLIYYKQNLFELAYDNFSQALAKDPDFKPAQINLALTWNKLKEIRHKINISHDQIIQNQKIIQTFLLKENIVQIQSGKSITVLPFTSFVGFQQIVHFGTSIKNMFLNGLINLKRFKIIEREKFSDMQREIKLSKSKWSDKRYIISIGKIIPAQYILTGSFRNVNNSYEIDYRIFSSATGEVVVSSSITGNNLLLIRKNIYESLKKLRF